MSVFLHIRTGVRLLAVRSMFVNGYIEGVIKDYLGGDAKRFDELWLLVPGFGENLRAFNSDASWLHWSKKTFDGWYCIAAQGGYEVYYQERGHVSQRRLFTSEKEATRFAINESVYTLPE